MKSFVKIIFVLVLFISCGQTRKVAELKKYKEWSYLDSLKIVEIAGKYGSTLSEIEKLSEKNKYLDSLLTECESKKH